MATGQITSPHVVGAFDLSRFRRLVDLGGGTGHLAIAACKAYPELSRDSVSTCQRHVRWRGEFKPKAPKWPIGSLSSRVISSTDPLPPADLYVLARTPLHDWNEAMVVELLSKVYASLKAGGAVLIAEKNCWAKAKPRPDTALMQHLNMLAIADGREAHG